MKVVINTCFGGFGLSPEALLELWDAGVTDIGTLATEWFKNGGMKVELNRWRKYKTAKKKPNVWNITVFSPDEKYVLYYGGILRDNEELVRVVEKLGDKANGDAAELSVVDIPDDVKWEISNYDGKEHIAERHRAWY